MTSEKAQAEDVAARAVDLFNGGFNCAEAVATAVAEVCAPGQKCFPRVATCFGGGLGRQGETCGAVIGGLLAIAYVQGRGEGEGDEAKSRCYDLARNVVEPFRGRFGGVLCRELIGVDLRTPEGRRIFSEQKLHNKYCTAFVGEAARLALRQLGFE